MKCSQCGESFHPHEDDDEEEVCSACREAIELSARYHRENNPHSLSDEQVCRPQIEDDYDIADCLDYEDRYQEPCGSCDECGTNLYPDEDYDGLCDQCAWLLDQCGEDDCDEV